MNNYVQVEPLVWVKEDELKTLSLVDSLILDIDGVVLDVSSSFRVAISQTVQHYFFRLLKFKGDEILLRPSETQLFKLAGGFNNDWDLSSAAILFYLVKAETLGTKDLPVLREKGQSLKDFTAAVRRVGGGIEGVKEVLFSGLAREKRLKVEKVWNQDKVAKLFQELYGGVDYCKKLYGFKPPYNRRKGLINEERILIKEDALKSFLPKVAILTGRTKKETEAALERASLKDLIPKKQIIFDGGLKEEMKKPRPGALLKLADILKSKLAVYVGDVLDDLKTVRNANQADLSRLFLSCIIVSPLRREEVSFYQAEKADIISLDVNRALKVIGGER